MIKIVTFESQYRDDLIFMILEAEALWERISIASGLFFLRHNKKQHMRYISHMLPKEECMQCFFSLH